MPNTAFSATEWLLAPDEPAPLQVVNITGKAPFVLVCEHAGNAIPRSLHGLSLPQEELDRHIAWDIGAAEVARGLSQALDAPLFLQHYSRLVIDCNRPRQAASLVPASSDGTRIAANEDLGEDQIAQRWEQIHQPLHAAIASELERAPRRALLTVHSFTPQLRTAPTQARHTHLGLLFDTTDSRFADALQLALGDEDGTLQVDRNLPYAVDGISDYAIPVHGIAHGRPNLLLEIRNDLIFDSAGQQAWIARLARALHHPAVSAMIKDAF